jgi:hypothetical protein
MLTQDAGRGSAEQRQEVTRTRSQTFGARRSRKLALLLLLPVCACYKYYAVDEVEPMPEATADVRIRFAAPVSLEAGSQTVDLVSGVEGEVYRSTRDTLGVYSRWLRTSYGLRKPMDGAVFFFDRSQFSRLEERRFVPLRSAIVAAVVAGGIVAAFDWAIDIGGGSEPSGDGSKGGGEFNISVPFPFTIFIKP